MDADKRPGEGPQAAEDPFTDISGDAPHVAYAAVVSPSGDIVPVTAEVAAADEPAPGEDSEPDEPYVPV